MSINNPVSRWVRDHSSFPYPPQHPHFKKHPDFNEDPVAHMESVGKVFSSLPPEFAKAKDDLLRRFSAETIKAVLRRLDESSITGNHLEDDIRKLILTILPEYRKDPAYNSTSCPIEVSNWILFYIGKMNTIVVEDKVVVENPILSSVRQLAVKLAQEECAKSS